VILNDLQDPYLAIAQLMYGPGLKLIEAMLNCRRLPSIAMIEGITHVDALCVSKKLSFSGQPNYFLIELYT
jgi:hypothetical protein